MGERGDESLMRQGIKTGDGGKLLLQSEIPVWIVQVVRQCSLNRISSKGLEYLRDRG